MDEAQETINDSKATPTEAVASAYSGQEEVVPIKYNSGLLPIMIVVFLIFISSVLIPFFTSPEAPKLFWHLLGILGIFTLAFLPLFYVTLMPFIVSISAAGLTFSSNFRTMAGRRTRSWDDLHSIQLVNVGSSGAADSAPLRWRGKHFINLKNYAAGWNRINFDFKSGGSASIDLPYLRRDQGEQLLRAIDRWGDSAKLAAPVVNLQRSILLETDTMLSATTLWQEDLTAQYVATNYVPLPSNHSLQDGNLKVLMELAAGGMSAVYLAEDKHRGKVVLKEAVTPLDAGDKQREKARELFAREAKLLEKLDHPNIAHVLDHFVERGRDYLVLEYIPGVTLRQTIKGGGRQKESIVTSWAQQILGILAYLHGQNPPIIHRDLTPDNLILSRDNRVVLVDFGAANEFVGTATGTLIGKQCYISPEQLRGKAVPQSDIYSFGGCIFYCLTGQDPTPLSVSDPKKLAPGTSAALIQLVSRCTAFEAEERPQSATAISEMLHPSRQAIT